MKQQLLLCCMLRTCVCVSPSSSPSVSCAPTEQCNHGAGAAVGNIDESASSLPFPFVVAARC